MSAIGGGQEPSDFNQMRSRGKSFGPGLGKTHFDLVHSTQEKIKEAGMWDKELKDTIGEETEEMKELEKKRDKKIDRFFAQKLIDKNIDEYRSFT